ncbi:PIN domain-containing protein [Candidatus Woesearchaeota archaeon]|nr:PIN domain-containing protein [Candidatus Woesearchaeota archaeon]
MKRILLDTNVYGRLMEDKEFLSRLLILVPSFFVVYGSTIIRQELRDISKKAKFQGKSKRTFALSVYDAFIRKENHTLQNTDLILLIAHKYFEAYKQKKGSFSFDELLVDFTLVALASFHKLDLIVSNDKRTMVSDKAKAAFSQVNTQYQLRTPEFYTYENFKKYVGGNQLR